MYARFIRLSIEDSGKKKLYTLFTLLVGHLRKYPSNLRERKQKSTFSSVIWRLSIFRYYFSIYKFIWLYVLIADTNIDDVIKSYKTFHPKHALSFKERYNKHIKKNIRYIDFTIANVILYRLQFIFSTGQIISRYLILTPIKNVHTSINTYDRFVSTYNCQL